ncbi:MAG: phosphomethylpyrimidine synthase ThiC [Candidatus Thermoplasmatota archaeon]
MKTQLECAKAGIITSEMRKVSKKEGKNAEELRMNIEEGKIVIMKNLGIGYGLRTKLNANIGTSANKNSMNEELKKAKIAEKYGADTISDLSMSGNIDLIRKKIMSITNLPITTVPIYQVIAEKKAYHNVKKNDIIEMIEKHCKEVNSIVLHAGFTLNMLELLKRKKRIMGMVSKGGAITSAWMLRNEEENPFLQMFSSILPIIKKKDVVLSLGNTMRSGCIYDRMDKVQRMEIELNSKLSKIANEEGVQVIVEGMGGHVDPREIPRYVRVYKKKIEGRPLFISGPLPTDVAVGYDHIAGAVGAAIATGAGADYLCYITPSEHLALPKPEHVKEGIIAYRIACHIGDAIKYGLNKRDLMLALRRAERDWEGQFKYALEPNNARKIYSPAGKSCTMCGRYCAIAMMEKYLAN